MPHYNTDAMLPHNKQLQIKKAGFSVQKPKRTMLYPFISKHLSIPVLEDIVKNHPDS